MLSLLVLVLCATTLAAQPALGERPRLWASAEGGQRVRLLWTAPAGVSGYRLLRDGQPLALLDAGAVAYVDETARPGTRYRYELQPQGAGTPVVATLVMGPATEAAEARSGQFDAVVYGATPGGIAAAVALGRRGRRVALVEPTEALGGMITGGLGRTDFGSIHALGGPFREFMEAVSAWYSQHYPADHPNQAAKRDGLYFEPSVARAIFTGWLSAQPTVTVLRECHLVGMVSDGGRARAAVIVDRRRAVRRVLTAPVFIDASYEGDLAAAAGARYRIGREPKTEFGEPHAGRLWWDVWQRKVMEVPGEGDRVVQAYNYRLCLTRDPANRLDPPRPLRFDRERYVGLLADIDKGRLKALTDILSILPLPGDKFDANNHPQGNPSSDLVRGADTWPEADWDTRVTLVGAHRDHIVGLLWFLRGDPAVPEKLRADTLTWGLAADEFPEQEGWPSCLYVREGRRIVGETIFTQHDAMSAPGQDRPTAKADAIAVGAYPMDSHATGGRHPEHPDWLEGFFYLARGETRPYGIPYGVMLPRGVSGVVVCSAVSSTHVGYGSLRMEPVFMSLGLAAGLAADHALTEHRSPADLDRERLQLDLLGQRQVLCVFEDVSFDTPGWVGFQILGCRGAFPGYLAEPDKPLTGRVWREWVKLALGKTADVPDDDQPLTIEALNASLRALGGGESAGVSRAAAMAALVPVLRR
ncbi:MAG: FAD-dependent oxidoreductase [Armatimonadetes bacterium]|nr:FAD-dependent oxidoreductase [Armatimonadota bacterium]